MKRVARAKAAIDDLERFKAFDLELGGGAPQVIIDRIVLATDWLIDWPYAGRPIGIAGWRKWKPRRTAHVLIYRPIADGIEVGRVRHERENWLAEF